MSGPRYTVRTERAVPDQGGAALRMVVTGELDLLAEDDVARALREAVGQAGATSVVLDLTEVGFIDSSGLRALLQGRDAASARGLSFALAVVDGPVTRLLAAAGVSEWFDYA